MAFNITDFNNKWANFKEELARHFNHALDKDGDTMNGSLLLSKNPTDNMEAVTKEYVDYFWSFVPGDTIIKQSQQNGIYIRFNPQSLGNITFPYSLPMKDNSGNDVSMRPICIQPKADGFIRFSGVMSPITFNNLYGDMGSGGYYELSPERDFKMSYSAKYCREGYDDIVVYESPVFSMYEVVNDENHQLRQQTFECALPVSRGVNGHIKLENLIHSSTLTNNLNYWYIQNVAYPSFGFTISVGNPIFTL